MIINMYYSFFCTLCDSLIPLALPSFACKKLLCRWIFIPPSRPLYARLLGVAVAPLVERLARQDGGGLVFFDLTRS